MSDNLGAVLERAARLHGDREASVDGDERWTYAELRQRVAAFDAALDGLGLQPGDVVGVLAHNSSAHLVCWLGIPRSGRVLNDLNTRLAPAELEFILGDSGARALIVDDAFLERGKALKQACPTVEHLVHAGAEPDPDCLSFASMMEGEGGPPATVDPDQLAGIFYTGGTTGLPKGAMLSHRNLVSNAKHLLIAMPYGPHDAYFHAGPMFHLADGASTYAITWVGGKHVMHPSFDPGAWLRVCEQERCTKGLLVPTMINAVLNHPDVDTADLSSLDSLLYGASPMPLDLLRGAMAKLGCGWFQGYGMTEASPLVTVLSREDHERGAAGEEPFASRLTSAGAPICGVEAEVRRSDGSPADVGEPGEIWVRGANVMLGYWNRPDETAAALDADGWYHSGDAAYMDEGGYLFVVDRVKDMIVSGGENVYCAEVESALHSHEAVLEVAVFGIPHDTWVETVHAAVVLHDGAEVTEQELIDHCRPMIAGYKVPRGIDFHGDPLPKSGAGKLLKRDLRAPYWEGRDRQV